MSVRLAGIGLRPEDGEVLEIQMAGLTNFPAIDGTQCRSLISAPPPVLPSQHPNRGNGMDASHSLSAEHELPAAPVAAGVERPLVSGAVDNAAEAVQ